MRVIAIEEHYITQALREANLEHPLVRNIISERLLGQLLDLSEPRLASMDAAGIDVQVLSHTTPGPESLEASLAVRLAVEANDLAAEAVAAHPNRFVGFATLPTPDPDAAAKELERTVGGLGFVGAIVNGHVNGRYLDDRFFWPMFEAAQARWMSRSTCIPPGHPRLRSTRCTPDSPRPSTRPSRAEPGAGTSTRGCTCCG